MKIQALSQNPVDTYKNLKQTDMDEFDRQLLQSNLKILCQQVFNMKSLLDIGHEYLFEFLSESKKRKKLILTPRETYKTSILTVGIAIQEILKNPNISILLSSYIQSNAESFLRVIKSYFENNLTLKNLFGNFVSDKWNETEIIIKQRKLVDKTPTVSVSGVDKATTSQHYDMIFLDDIVNRQTVSTVEQIEKTERYYSDVADLLKKPNGKLFVIGTRWDGNDLYGKLIKKHSEDFDILNLMATHNGTLSGECLYPKKLDRQVLEGLLRDKGSYDFYLQYMNTITSSDTKIFKPPFRYWSVNDLRTAKNCIAFDPATSERKNSCEAVVMASGLNESSQLCVLGYTIFREKEKIPLGMINKIFEYMNRFGCKNVIVETNGGQEVYVHLLHDEAKKRKVSINVIEVHQSRSKESRILALQSYFERGDLLLKQGMTELEDQFNLFRVPINSQVDVLDALAMRIQEEIPMTISQGNFPSKDQDVNYHEWGWHNGVYIPPSQKDFEGMNYTELIKS